MATTTYSNTSPVISLRDRLSSRIDAMRADLAKRRVYRRTVAELSALSNRDLADLGLNRSEVRSIAHQAAYGN